MNSNKLRTVAGYTRHPKTFTGAEEVLDLLRERIRTSEIRYSDIAAECNISVATLYAIRNGKTKWPRPKTFFPLLSAFGLEMVIKDKAL